MKLFDELHLITLRGITLGQVNVLRSVSFLKPGFHIVVSVVSVIRKKFIGQVEFILSRTTSCICRFFCIEHLYERFP